MNSLTLDSTGRVLATLTVPDATVTYNNGLAFMGEALCVTVTPASTDVWQEGIRRSAIGQIVVMTGPSGGALFYNGGLPVEAVGNALVTSTNVVPQPQDAFVAGMRISDLTGLYFYT